MVGGPRIDGRITLKRILKKYGVRLWTGLTGLMIGSSGGLL